MSQIYCPNCELLVETSYGFDKRNHCVYCGIVLGNLGKTDTGTL